MSWKPRVILVPAAALYAACASAQAINAFEGLKNSYAISDTVEFEVQNTSNEEWFYWIELEYASRDRWSLVYVSLAHFRSTMVEPVIESIQPGQTVTVRWTPNADSRFTEIYHRPSIDVHLYRLVLKQKPSREVLAGPGTPSKPFLIE